MCIRDSKQPEDILLDEEETRRYQGIVGCLMYIAQGLRYDLIYVTDQLDDRLSYHLQTRRFQTRCLLRLELGQQPRQREVDLVLYDHASECSR